MDRFGEMEMFVRVVEAGGFTEAARRCGVSKSAVSKQISALERRLGARLLNRTTRRVSPTEIGMAYFDRAVRILSDAEEADAIVASLQGAPRGELRVSAPNTYGLRVVSPLLAQFLTDHEEIGVHLSLDDRFVDLISEGFDLAIRIGELEDSSLRARRIAEARVALVAAPSYLERFGTPDSIQALNEHALLHYSYSTTGRSWPLKGPEGARSVRASGRLTVNNGESLLCAVENGLGVALLPDFIYGPSERAGRVTPFLEEVWPDPLGVWAVTPPGRYTQPKVAAFIDHLALRLKQGDAERVEADEELSVSAAAE